MFFLAFQSMLFLQFYSVCRSFQGTSAEQDSRFTDKQKKLLKVMRFEEVLTNKVQSVLEAALS